ncbi:GntR family transcriptional regulator [Salinisphaera aquimarina]|uniref:GntR family transcriptional regulator n=1 Tax=Salinisphaera aquimarina TaxID=2094031 RepID=A0ABV7EQ83_9GAMM
MTDKYAAKPDKQPNVSQAEIVRHGLARDIMVGRLTPGDFLSESQIGQEYGVSRTPVREAIRSLAADGLVTLRPRQRAVVKGQTAAEILDQFEAMAELEAACARLAARRRGRDELARMEKHQAECRTRCIDADPTHYYEANVGFHEAIYAASGNHYLWTETLRLRDRMWFLRITQGRLPGRLAESSSEHDAVLAAIRTQDEEAAANAMRTHLILQGESLHTMLRHTNAAGIVHISEMHDSVVEQLAMETGIRDE